jgi:peptidoglycan/LPS O-acetylase OafA/YrhL
VRQFLRCQPTPSPIHPHREIKPLTGLRGVAALWVVSCHWSGAELTGPARDVALHGYAAVDLFMILSGFVLAMTYEQRFRPAPWNGWGAFVWQRFCRLYPLYALTTLVCLIEDWGQWRHWPLSAIASNFLMTTTNLWDVDAINGPSWSISVEFTLNLFFPLFVLLCARLSWRWSVVVGALAALALVAASVLDHRVNGGVAGALGTLDTRLMYLRCGPEFALGMLCWRFRGKAAACGRTPVLCGTLLAMLAMTPFKSLDLPFVAASCALVIGLSVERSRLASVFGARVPHWLGTISFSLYLWHAAFLPLRPLELTAMGPMTANTLNLALVLALSTLSYRRFEVPMRRWLRARIA